MVDFQAESVNLKIHDLNGKNYQFSVPRLAKKIVPSASKVLVKPKRIILTLKKADFGSWFDLSKKEDKVMHCATWVGNTSYTSLCKLYVFM